MILSIVISAYNEEGNIHELYNQLIFNLQKCNNLEYEFLFNKLCCKEFKIY